MLRRRKIRLLWVLPVLLAALPFVAAGAQEHADETPLGDVARNLRKKIATRPVIDDDNLPQVMRQFETRQNFGSSLRFLMGSGDSGFKVAAPDVTCSLAFSANAKSLLSSQYAQMQLPPGDAAKLQGHATIEEDALSVSVLNATDWHVSEIGVALTVIRKRPDADASGIQDVTGTTQIPPGQEVHPEKKPDDTTIYHMRAAAAPWATAVFSAPLNVELAPGDEWHWSMVEVRGYPPQSTAQITSEATANLSPLSPLSPR